ncbi:MFS transporter [Shimazuella sp. AN120528]|uniref:MFS transporter n=1 Tax=Shimazuella soli TaxID=1892854 RepID=UPI001F11670C|nr:MFS transporter [Shimazuella soli]MCH5584801.1 MFS transporter [Shimazuella soli]
MSNRFLIILLAIGAFIAGTGELVISGIVDLIASDLHVSLAVSGQLVTMFSISFAIGSPIVIALTSKMNRKKLLLVTLIISALGGTMAMLSENIIPMMLSRIILGICSGVFNSIAFAMAAGLVTPDKRGSAIGSIQVGFSCSLIVGVPIGITITAHFGWHTIFGLLAAANMVILLLIVKLLPNIASSELKQSKIRSNLGNFRVAVTLFIAFLNVLGYSICFTFITPYLQTLAHLSHSAISGILLLMGVCGAVGSRLGGYGTDKWGVTKTLLMMLAFHTVSLLLSPFMATTLVGIIVTITIWGISVYATVPTILYYLISLAPDAAEMVISLNTSVFQIGIAVGAAVGGIIVNNLSVFHVGWIGGITVAVGLIVAIFFLSLERKVIPLHERQN